MYYILFGGRKSRENIELCTNLEPNWVTYDTNPENFLKALQILNKHNPDDYNLVLLDPYLANSGKRFDYIGNVLKLNHHKRKTAIIKDTRLENTVGLFRDRYKFHELSKESNLVQAVSYILNLN